MKKLQRLIILVIVMLLSCLRSYSIDNPSTGEADSISISINQVRILDKKLIEYESLKLEKSLWEDLDNNRIQNISYLEKQINNLQLEINNKNKIIQKDKSIKKFFIGTSAGLGTVVLILLIL